MNTVVSLNRNFYVMLPVSSILIKTVSLVKTTIASTTTEEEDMKIEVLNGTKSRVMLLILMQVL